MDAFVALAFVGKFTTGAVLAFLVFGPMIDIKSTIMYASVFQRRAVIYLILLVLVLTMLPLVLMNLNVSW